MRHRIAITVKALLVRGGKVMKFRSSNEMKCELSKNMIQTKKKRKIFEMNKNVLKFYLINWKSIEFWHKKNLFAK